MKQEVIDIAILALLRNMPPTDLRIGLLAHKSGFKPREVEQAFNTLEKIGCLQRTGLKEINGHDRMTYKADTAMIDAVIQDPSILWKNDQPDEDATAYETAFALYSKDWETEMKGLRFGTEEYKKKQSRLFQMHPKIKDHIEYLNRKLTLGN